MTASARHASFTIERTFKALRRKVFAARATLEAKPIHALRLIRKKPSESRSLAPFKSYAPPLPKRVTKRSRRPSVSTLSEDVWGGMTIGG